MMGREEIEGVGKDRRKDEDEEEAMMRVSERGRIISSRIRALVNSAVDLIDKCTRLNRGQIWWRGRWIPTWGSVRRKVMREGSIGRHCSRDKNLGHKAEVL